MERETRIKANTTEALVREVMSDEELGNLVSAFGNSEVKAITLGLMQPGNIYSAGGFHTALTNAQGQNVVRMDRRAGFKYCQQSLSPIGLVTREVIEPDLSIYGYLKTPYGESVGDPLAGGLLDFSLRHPEYSLRDFFAITNSASRAKEDPDMDFRKRASISRLRIFRELLTSALPLRSIDLARRTGTDLSNMAEHLIALSEKGIVNYDTTRKGKPRFFYKFSENAPDTQPDPYRYNRAVTNFIYRLLKSNPDKQWGGEEIRDSYAKQLRDENRPVSKWLGITCAEALSYLARGGYAKTGKFFSGKQSEAYIDKDQRNVLSDLVNTLDEFQHADQDTIEFGRRRLREILTDPKHVSGLIAKAKEHSTQRMDVVESAGYIRSIIASHPHSTAQDLIQIIRSEGRKLSMFQLTKILRLVIADGSASFSLEKDVRHYELSKRKAPRPKAKKAA